MRALKYLTGSIFSAKLADAQREKNILFSRLVPAKTDLNIGEMEMNEDDTLKMLEDVIDQIEISEGRSVTVDMLRNFVVGRRRAEADGMNEDEARKKTFDYLQKEVRDYRMEMEALGGMSPASRNESKDWPMSATEIESNWWREKQRIIDQQAKLIEILLEALRLTCRLWDEKWGVK